MSDQRDCTDTTQPFTGSPSTPPPPADPLGPPAAIREALLWRLEDPFAARMLRRIGDLLFEILDERGQFGPSPERDGLTRPALQAAARDLFHTARDLAEIALTADTSTLTPTDLDLARSARIWSARVTTLAAEIHQATET